MAPRERFFVCVFEQDRNEYRFHVRAWTAEEAEAHLRASLREDGVRDPGSIVVRDERGAVLASSPYRFDVP